MILVAKPARRTSHLQINFLYMILQKQENKYDHESHFLLPLFPVKELI